MPKGRPDQGSRPPRPPRESQSTLEQESLSCSYHGHCRRGTSEVATLDPAAPAATGGDSGRDDGGFRHGRGTG